MKLSEVKNKIVTCYGGSIAYGTNTPESDVDIRGLFCADRESIRTPFFPVKEVTLEDQEDGKLYELTNFMRLYCDMNPNILEMLWVDESSILESSPTYEYLRSQREHLLSTKCAFTFSGYAISQLKRIKGHNKWINNPQPEEPVKHRDYVKLVQNFTEHRLFPRDFTLDHLRGKYLKHYGDNLFGVFDVGDVCALASNWDFNVSAKQAKDNSQTGRIPLYLVKYCESEYKQEKETRKNYWNWRRNRNKKRSALEEKYGFDCKHASHVFRLLKMSEEILKGEGVIVKRPDAEEILAIRNGSMTYDELLEWAEDKDKYIRGELLAKSKLPKKVDLKLASKILMEAQDQIWQE